MGKKVRAKKKPSFKDVRKAVEEASGKPLRSFASSLTRKFEAAVRKKRSTDASASSSAIPKKTKKNKESSTTPTVEAVPETEPTQSVPETEPETKVAESPSVAPSTTIEQDQSSGNIHTPSIPIDLVQRLLQHLSTRLDLVGTLAAFAAEP